MYSKEWWEARIPLIHAFVEGESVQVYDEYLKCWNTTPPNSTLKFDKAVDSYRIKVEPKYRPYFGLLEFTNSMAKHGSDVIEYRPLDGSTQWRTRGVAQILATGIFLINFGYVSYDDLINSTLNEYRWLDGTPCGIEIPGE